VTVVTEIEEDGPNGFDMTLAMGGFVDEHVMRWHAAPDGARTGRRRADRPRADAGGLSFRTATLRRRRRLPS